MNYLIFAINYRKHYMVYSRFQDSTISVWQTRNRSEKETLLPQWDVCNLPSLALFSIRHDGLSQVSTPFHILHLRPWIQLTNKSGSTSICGEALLNFISCFVTVRQFLTGSICFLRLYESMTPDSTLALDTKRTLEVGLGAVTKRSVSDSSSKGMVCG